MQKETYKPRLDASLEYSTPRRVTYSALVKIPKNHKETYKYKQRRIKRDHFTLSIIELKGAWYTWRW